ncbi:MAG: HD domain-containing protein [Veillonellales bacterium]
MENNTLMNYREKYIKELKEHFGPDQRRIQHALKVLNIAETIMDGEKVDAALRKIVTITALLHDVGIKAAEQKYHSSAGPYQEKEGPAIVRKIMVRQGEQEADIQRVTYIVGGHHTWSKNDGLDFQIIWEADLMVNIQEDGLDRQREKLPGIFAKNLRTAAGKLLAKNKYPD